MQLSFTYFKFLIQILQMLYLYCVPYTLRCHTYMFVVLLRESTTPSFLSPLWHYFNEPSLLFERCRVEFTVSDSTENNNLLLDEHNSYSSLVH